VPVEVKGKFHQKINETRIEGNDWPKAHWETIRHTYGKAPFFYQFKDIFEPLYLSCSEEYLSKVNYRFLKAFCELLEIKTEFKWSSEFELRGDKSEKLLNLCHDLGATTYYSGPAAKDYMDESLFLKNGVTVEWLDYSGYPEYPQLNGEFEHGVSILDLFFNTGADAKKYMKSFSNV